MLTWRRDSRQHWLYSYSNRNCSCTWHYNTQVILSSSLISSGKRKIARKASLKFNSYSSTSAHNCNQTHTASARRHSSHLLLERWYTRRNVQKTQKKSERSASGRSIKLEKVDFAQLTECALQIACSFMCDEAQLWWHWQKWIFHSNKIRFPLTYLGHTERKLKNRTHRIHSTGIVCRWQIVYYFITHKFWGAQIQFRTFVGGGEKMT